MKHDDWETIHALTEAARMAAETRLAHWLHREADISAAIERLSDRAEAQSIADTAASRAGADLRWQAWCNLRRTEALAELARVRYRRLAAEETMRQAARRSIATEAVLRKERAMRVRSIVLREERDGQG